MTPAPERPEPTRYRNVRGWMVEDTEGQWMHVSDVGIEKWNLDPEPSVDRVWAAAPVTDAGLREIEDAMLAIANLPLTKERGDDLLRVIRAALAAAPVTDAGLDVERLAHAYNNALHDSGRTWLPLPMPLWQKIAAEYAALSRQAEKETA